MEFTHKVFKPKKRDPAFSADYSAILLGWNTNSSDMLEILNSKGVESAIVYTNESFQPELGKNNYDNDKVDSLSRRLTNYLNRTVFVSNRAVVISSEDIYTILLCSSTEPLDARLTTSLIPKTLAARCANKIEFHALCLQLNIATPKTFILKSRDMLLSYKHQLPYPGIVKPHFSGALPKSVIPKILIIQTEAELLTIAEKIWSLGQPVLYQDLIPGGSDEIWFSGGLFSSNAEETNFFIGQKLLEYPYSGGTTALARLSWNNDVANIVEKFVNGTGYQGLIDVELKYDRRDGQFKMIEVNPRIGRWHTISKSDEFDIISYYFMRRARIATTKTVRLHQDGRTWISPHLALCGFIDKKGLLRGMTSWLIIMPTVDIKTDIKVNGKRLLMSQLRFILGHLKSLSIKTLLIGKG